MCLTCVFGGSWAVAVAAADVVAGCDHNAVGHVAGEVREHAHRSRVVAVDGP